MYKVRSLMILTAGEAQLTTASYKMIVLFLQLMRKSLWLRHLDRLKQLSLNLLLLACHNSNNYKTYRIEGWLVRSQRKDQIASYEQIAREYSSYVLEMPELLEEQKLARKQEEEANIALIESWENTQAMMEADRLLAERL
ncbi:hypothetical protein Tco_1455715 [Tanacetum coccineum]